MASAGINHPDGVTRDVVSTRVERNKTETFGETFPELEPGCLLEESSVPDSYRYFWKKATAESF